MSKPGSRLCMPIKKPISEHNEWAFIIRPNFILSYYIKWFCRKTCLKNERKTMRGEAFWGLKNPENPGASGGSAPGPPPGRCPWTSPGALERAPGPHAVKTLRSPRSNWTQTLFIQHPAVNKSCTRPWYSFKNIMKSCRQQQIWVWLKINLWFLSKIRIWYSSSPL